MAAIAQPSAAMAATPLAIRVVGNHFVNGDGQTIRLLGADREGTEYACVDGTGYSVGPEDASDAAAIASWHTNAVRIPLNEDCWLGINGLPAYGTADGYRQMIASYVSALNAKGIYAILDLQWNAPGDLPAKGLRTMPDEHSLAFWTSVASTLAANPAVLFDAFNEPHSVGWSCWRDGGCAVPQAQDGTTPDPTQTYTAVGMQSIVNDIRAAGAHQPILLGGLDHGNDLSGWLANMPTDSDRQLAAVFHVYQPNSCATTSCWDGTVAPVAASVPVTTAEFSESDCSENWDNTLMAWDDAHGIGYLAWGWFILTHHCQSLYLITDWNGTPEAPNGTALHDHLAALAAGDVSLIPNGGTPTSSGGTGLGGPGCDGGGVINTGACEIMAPPARSAIDGPASAPIQVKPTVPVRPKLQARWIRLTRNTLSVRLRSSQHARGKMGAAVGGSLAAIAPHHPRPPIVLGSKRFYLPAHTWRVISFRLSPRARRVLARGRRATVKITVTVTATGTGGRTAKLARVIEVRPHH